MVRFTYHILFFFLFVSCNNLNEQTQVQDDYPELKALINNYYSAMSQRDWPAYKEFFADEAILTTIWQGPNDSEPKLLSNSITEFLAQTKDGPDSQPIFEEKPLTIDIERKSDLANAWVYYEAKFGTEDNLVEWKGYDLFSLLEYNGKWFITSITYLSEE